MNESESQTPVKLASVVNPNDADKKKETEELKLQKEVEAAYGLWEKAIKNKNKANESLDKANVISEKQNIRSQKRLQEASITVKEANSVYQKSIIDVKACETETMKKVDEWHKIRLSSA